MPQFRDFFFFFFNGGFITKAWLIINSVSSPCFFPGGWGRAGSFKLLVMPCLSGGQCLSCPGVHQELPPYNQRLCYLPGSSQRYRSFCVRPTSPPSVQRWCRGFQELWLGAGTQDQNIYIFSYHIGNTVCYMYVMVCYIDWFWKVIWTLKGQTLFIYDLLSLKY